MKKILLGMLVLLGGAGAVVAQISDTPVAPAAAKYLTIRTIPEYTRVTRGQSFHVALDARIASEWAWYGPAPGAAAREIKIPPARIETQAGMMKTGATRWPRDFLKPPAYGFPAVWSYKKRAILYVPLTVPADASLGEQVITFRPWGQICGPAGCINIQGLFNNANYVMTTAVTVADAPEPNPAWRDDKTIAGGRANAMTADELRVSHVAERQVGKSSTETSSLGFWAAIGIALLAGLTLNVMPCVLPVIPIRILSIVEMAGHSRRRFVTMGLAFAAGMMLFFVGIAAINIVLKLIWDTSFDINQGFQNPVVIITLSMIVVALAANLFGVFDVIVPRKVAGLEMDVQSRSAGHAKSVFMGLMLAVLATPCSFAFLAAALTYAQTAPLLAGTWVLLAVGLGMSAPHALLMAFPTLVDKLPRPGQWMELFKQTTGFILLLVAVWLLGTLRGGEGSSYPFWVIAWAVIFVLCLWMWANWVRHDASLRRKIIVRSLAVLLAAGSGAWMLRPPSPPLIESVKFRLAKIDQARAEGKVVLVKFTATWCAKCLQQDYEVYNTPKVANAIRELGVVYMKGDISRSNLPAARWMHENGYGVKIPMTIIFPPKGKPYPPIRSELTQAMLIEQLRKAAGRKKE